MPILYRNIEHPNPKRSSVSDPLKHIENVGQIKYPSRCAMIGLKKNWLGPNFVIAILRAYTYNICTSTYIHSVTDGDN